MARRPTNFNIPDELVGWFYENFTGITLSYVVQELLETFRTEYELNPDDGQSILNRIKEKIVE